MVGRCVEIPAVHDPPDTPSSDGRTRRAASRRSPPYTHLHPTEELRGALALRRVGGVGGGARGDERGVGVSVSAQPGLPHLLHYLPAEGPPRALTPLARPSPAEKFGFRGGLPAPRRGGRVHGQLGRLTVGEAIGLCLVPTLRALTPDGRPGHHPPPGHDPAMSGRSAPGDSKLAAPMTATAPSDKL